MIPQSLKDRLRRGDVIPFVGAGVSRSVLRPNGQPLFPGWRDLLLHAANLLAEEGKSPESMVVRGLLESRQPDFLEAARRAQDGLGPLWPEFLREQIDRRFEDANPESLDLARTIWGLGNPLIVTTNYDMVLQWACPDLLVKDLAFWDIEAKVEQGQLLKTGRPTHPTIWHLHGRIGNAAELVLTPDGYRRLYGNGSEQRYKAALSTFQTILASRSLLFIGFSFEDDALGVQLEGVNELFAESSGPHYALVHARDLGRLHALNLPVDLISFSEFGGPLLSLVRELAEIAKPGDVHLSSLSSTPSPVASYSTDNRPFFVPFRAKGDRVIGAEEALQRVRDQLTTGRPTSIGQTAAFQGLGGLGKTQLAVEYSWRFSEDYPNGVVWLTADQDIPAQLTRLAVEARWVASESEHKIKLEIAQHRLRSYSGCLIVFDNVEDIETLQPYLPLPSAKPHLLATSRKEQPGFVPVALDILDEEQSIALLTSEAGCSPVGVDEAEAAREIARELGGLPLALEMAGAYLMYRSVKWRQYRDLLGSNPKAAFRPKLLASFTGHEADLFATLRIQEGLFEDEPHLRGILDALTWSGSAPMGLSLLAAILSAEATDLLGALSLGVKLRLLERSVDTDRYGLHRLLRKVRQEDRPLTEDPKWVEQVCQRLGDWFYSRRRDFADLATFEAEIDHLQQWRERAEALGTTQTSRLTWLLAYPPFHRGQYSDSHTWLDKALSLYKSACGLDRELNAWIWHDLGTITELEGRLSESLEFKEQALTIRRQILGEEHRDTADSLDGLGVYHQQIHDLDRALDYYTQALSIRLKLAGEEHPDTANSYNNIGWAYCERNELDLALKYQMRALSVRHELGYEHPDTARSLGAIGLIYYKSGDFGNAVDHYSRALAIQLRMLGEEHPQTVLWLEHIGNAYRKNRDFDKALEYSTRVLAIRRKVLGEEHPATASGLYAIGEAYSAMGNLKAALEFYLQSLEARRRILGLFNRGTINSVLNSAILLRQLGRPMEAFNLVEPYIKDPPNDHEQARKIKTLAQQLKANPLRPGFRSPAAKGKKDSKKRRR